MGPFCKGKRKKQSNGKLFLLLLLNFFISDVVAPPSPSPRPSPSPTPTPAPAPKPAYTTGDWGECSVSCGGGTQTRAVSCSGNNGCSGTQPSSSRSCNTAACTCEPNCKTVNVDNTTNAIWEVKTNSNFYGNLNLSANVGDGILFKYSTNHDVYKLATKWHYDTCNFEDAIALGGASDGSGSGYEYTVGGADDKRRIYFACSKGSHCQLGQKVDVKIGEFEHATLKSATNRIIKSRLYDFNSIEQIWCFVEHCPHSAMTYYDNDAAKANKMCEADAYNLLGFVYRKKKGPNFVRSENYYLKALQLVPGHCGARSYLGELYVQTSNMTFAKTTLNRLISDCGRDSSEVVSLLKHWKDKGWCKHLPAGVQYSKCVVDLGKSEAVNDRGEQMSKMLVLVIVNAMFILYL